VTAATEVPITPPASGSSGSRKKASASASASASSSAPCARFCAACAVHDGVLFVLGGAVKASARDVARGILVTALWDLHAFTPASPSDPARGGAWAAVPLTGAAPPAAAERYGAGLYSAAHV
jgi:hypothetical protein